MSETNIDIEHVVEEEAPPGVGGGIGEVLRKNLFKDVPNGLLTILFAIVFGYLAWKAFGFVFSNQKLNPEGELVDAWRVISEQLEFYMVGTRFSDTGISFGQLWAAIYLLVFTLGLGSAAPKAFTNPDVPKMTRRTQLGIALPPVVAGLVLLSMTDTITPKVLTVGLVAPFLLGQLVARSLPTSLHLRKGQIMGVLALAVVVLESNLSPSNIDRFGGLLLTVNIAFISIALCFPIGVIMALMRRSSFPLLRPLAVGYIELIRGVPLITLLFMGQFAIGFFLPPAVQDTTLVRSSVLRAIFMVTIFSGAYVAEIVRGGLQSVPSGQTEAGQAVGLSPVTVTRKIVLPQALRTSIPALVGQFIALLKDTTLVTIIGLFDLLGVSDPILASPQFQNQGYAPEVYAFVAFMFWVMCFSMSRASQRLETKLGVGTR